MKKILITGAAGYLGSTISTLFVNNGYEVIGVDNLFFKKNTLKHLENKKNFEFLNLDVRDESVITKLLPKSDIIFPLAGIVGAPLCDKLHDLTYEINELAIENLIKNISSDQIIIYPTTNSGYGTTSKDIICTEEMPLKPISHYGRTKVNAEKIILEHDNSISLRLATVFGISYRNRIDLLVNFFVYNAVKFKKIKLFEPHFRRNYIHVKDIVDAFVFAINNFEKLKNNIYNLGLSSANITKIQLAKKIKRHIKDLKIKIIRNRKDPDKRDYFVSNKKIEKHGFKAKVSLDTGIKELIKIFKYCDIKFKNNY